MKKVLLVLAVLFICLIGIYFFLGDNYGKLYEQYKGLLEPCISEHTDQKMLEYKGMGDPNKTAMKAFSTLFKTYYSLKDVDKLGYVAPRARWPETDISKKNEWVGLYGVSVADTVNELPAGTDPNVKLVTWMYGKVAEILHVGPYSEEAPAIEKLKTFIASGGYKIAGAHEEEYLRGPGMFGPGNTKKYLTIIRYQVAKAEAGTKKK